MSKPFKLSSLLHGHSLDVRSLDITCDNNIVSGSRDKTAKYWRFNELNTGYVEAVTYCDQKNFVASVLYLESSNEHPDGLIITGGNDNKILVYKPHEPFATHCYEEHTNTVCVLSKGLEANSFLSASWDMTAKFWNLNISKNSLSTFKGHEAAVWGATFLKNTNIVTASADKTIRIWLKDGQQIKLITGHTDCVRGLLDFPALQCFLSISNDATIKVWSYDGDNINTYYGHSSFIYGICQHKSGENNAFITSGEDRSVRVWENGVNTQTIYLPAQSVWCVNCLQNGDIVTGSSDGVIRIFTQNETRFADESLLKSFEEEVNALTQQSSQEIGGYKVSDLPGKEALYEPGKKEGEMKMIRESHGVVAYTWILEGDNSHWEKVGDVLSGTNKNNEGQTMFEGKAYDYVFSVDVEDGKPPLKLPYNKGEDPYMAAHNFLMKNDLPPSYLDQVADFVIKNSKDAGNVPIPASGYVDPYTGASRYTPNAPLNANVGSSGVNLDPFTGESSYSTSSDMKNASVKHSSTQFFPQTTYKTFDMGDPTVVITKLKEFCRNVHDVNIKLSEIELDNLIYLCDDKTFDAQYMPNILKLLNWPEDYLFPAIDLLRFAVKSDRFNKEICLLHGDTVLDKLKIMLNSKIANNTLVTLRALCNLFTHSFGEEIIFKYRVDLLEALTSISSNNKNIQIGMATFLLNAVILILKKNDEIGLFMLASVLSDMIVILTDGEAEFRSLVALGTLISKSQTSYKNIKEKVIENNELIGKIKKCSSQNNQSDQKLLKCAMEVQSILK